METKYETIAFLESLWRIQEREGMSSRELAKQLGISDSAICRWRAGRRRPAWDMVQRIVREYPELVGAIGGE